MCARSSSWTPQRCPVATPLIGFATSWPYGSRRYPSSGQSWPTASSIWTIRCGSTTRRSTSIVICCASTCRRRAGARNWSRSAGTSHRAPLDRGKPLWEMWVIEGVADTDPCAGGVLAVMTKVHHAAVDGVTGANLLSQLCTVEPDMPPPEPVEGAGSAGPLQIAAGGLMRFASRPWQLANVLPTTVATIVKTLRRAGTVACTWPRRSRVRRPGSTRRSPPTATSRWPSWTSTTSRRSRTVSASRSTTW